jgi:hypothetical protein
VIGRIGLGHRPIVAATGEARGIAAPVSWKGER